MTNARVSERVSESGSGAWTTGNEINFIRGLGTWSLAETETPELLARYREAIKRRTDWGRIDPDEIRDELDVLQGVKSKRAKWRKFK